jgi:Lon-like ATP-dependent protease
MKESTVVAYSFAKSVMARDFPKNKFFEHARIHLHCPEGATPKDGPSAGITMTSSLLSLALGTPIKDNVAMTGEITLTGKVLRIGGLREKTVAARRAGAKTVIFPKDNESDWLELPEVCTSLFPPARFFLTSPRTSKKVSKAALYPGTRTSSPSSSPPSTKTSRTSWKEKDEEEEESGEDDD